MADLVYDATLSNSQLSDGADARFEAGFERFDRALKSARSAAEGLRDLAQSLISKTALPEAPDLDERLKWLDRVDRIGELNRFLECVYLGAASLGSAAERDALQTVLNHVIFGLQDLSKTLLPDPARADGRPA